MNKHTLQRSHTFRFGAFLCAGLVCLAASFLLTMVFGSTVIAPGEVLRALFAPEADNFTHITVRDIRLPRFLADLIVGASLSIAGAIMQGTTKNPMADSGIMGISSGSTLGVVIVLTFLPGAGRFLKMGVSAAGAAAVTLLIYAIAYVGKGRVTSDRMVLSGMAISTLLSSVTTSIILKNGLMSQMLRYTSGSSANVIWMDLAIALPFFAFGVIASLCISRSLTVMNLGEDVSRGLGARVAVIKTLSTLIVLILSAVAVVIIGPVGYIGLMIPYIARYMAGTDYRRVLPLCAVYGAAFVSVVDLAAKCVHPGREFPIGLMITIIGVPFFVYVSRRQEGDHVA